MFCCYQMKPKFSVDSPVKGFQLYFLLFFNLAGKMHINGHQYTKNMKCKHARL